MLNKIISYVVLCTIPFISVYAMERNEPEVSTKKREGTTQTKANNRDVRDKASPDLSPYKDLPPVELDQPLLELLFNVNRASTSPKNSENSSGIPSNHILYNNIWFGPKASDDKCALIQAILKKGKNSNSPTVISAVLVKDSIDQRSINTFTLNGRHPRSVFAQYDIYIGEDPYQESDKKPGSVSNPSRFMLSVTNNEAFDATPETTTPQLTASEKYTDSLFVLFKEDKERDPKSESLKTILYTYPFFISGKTLLEHLSELNKKYPEKIKRFMQLLANEASLGGKESMRLDEDDLKVLSIYTPPAAVQSKLWNGEVNIANLTSKKELNNDNYVDVITLDNDKFGAALWARDFFLLQSIPLKDLKRTDFITPLAWYSTQTSFWVAFQILTAQTKQEMFSKFLTIGENLLDANNVHGALQIIFGLSNGALLRVMEPPHKDKHENDLLKDERWLKLQNITGYPNADKHYDSSNPNRFLSFSALSGKLINWCEEYDLLEPGNVEILTGIAKVAESFVSLQRKTFSWDIKPQYGKLVCGIGFCDTGEIRQATLDTISSLLKEYQSEYLDPINISKSMTFEDLQDNCFSNFLENKGCEKKVILKIFSRGIFSGQQLIQYIKFEEKPFDKIEKLGKLGISEPVARSILDAQYAGVLDPHNYMPKTTNKSESVKEKEAKKSRQTSKSSSSKKK